MKNHFGKILISILLILFNSYVLNCQARYDHTGKVHSLLMQLIHERYGPEFTNVGFSILDSLISHSLRENERIRDPYKTLKGCILFSTYKDFGDSIPTTFITGMIKGGRIIWDNTPGASADLSRDLLYARDINNDGKVDLLVRENDWELSLMRGPFLYYLYILTWDGKKGTFINEFRVDGKSSLAGDGGYELIDKNKKGIYKIRTTLPDIGEDWQEYKTKTFPHITYSWNGKQYGFWPKKKSTSKDQPKVINNY